MFTGLVQEIGTVRKTGRRGGYRTLEIGYDPSGGELKTGDSMAVNGACLTATSVTPRAFAADLSEETQRTTTLGTVKAGDSVNLERPVSASDPLGGHIVLGHIDGVGRLRKVMPESGGLKITVHAPARVMDLLVDKGSVAVDGVSLTVGALTSDTFEIYLIPETQGRTTLGGKRVGDAVNLEADYLAKLVKKFLRREADGGSSIFPQVRGED